MVLFVFLFAGMQAFIWLNRSLVERQENYEHTRGLAGDPEVMRTQIPEVKWQELYEYSELAVNWNKIPAKNFVVNRFYSRDISQEVVDTIVSVATEEIENSASGFYEQESLTGKLQYLADKIKQNLSSEQQQYWDSIPDILDLLDTEVGRIFAQLEVNKRIATQPQLHARQQFKVFNQERGK